MHTTIDPPDRPAFEEYVERYAATRVVRTMLEDGFCPLCAERTVTVEWCGPVLVLACPCMPGSGREQTPDPS